MEPAVLRIRKGKFNLSTLPVLIAANAAGNGENMKNKIKHYNI
jgi:hypothetical protein